MKECRTFVTRTTRATPLDIRDTSYVKLKAADDYQSVIGVPTVCCPYFRFSPSLLAQSEAKDYDIVALASRFEKRASPDVRIHNLNFIPSQVSLHYVNERPSKSRQTRGSCCLYWSCCYRRSFTARNIAAA